MIYKYIILTIFFVVQINAVETSSSLTRQKMEVLELKNELNNFYNEKEKEYQTQKKELENLLAQVEKEKAETKRLHDKNLALLKDIRAEVQSKTVKIYDGMKAKNAAEIFDQMINEGKIEDVFDIILRLRESNVTQILKFLTVTNASRLTQKLEKYNLDKEKKD
ncbi:MotE family protein [Aliarcobacter butzleri]|uniref:MotE family protein n=1 Tax=Aliarcobacter butzleri TaxID=28197 RepID=UPI003B221E77